MSLKIFRIGLLPVLAIAELLLIVALFFVSWFDPKRACAGVDWCVRTFPDRKWFWGRDDSQEG